MNPFPVHMKFGGARFDNIYKYETVSDESFIFITTIHIYPMYIIFI